MHFFLHTDTGRLKILKVPVYAFYSSLGAKTAAAAVCLFQFGIIPCLSV